MKNIITTIAIITLTVTGAIANSTPEVLISAPSVEVVTVDHDIFTSSAFDVDSDNLVFNTNDKITTVQIFNSNGKLEFQLPVMSTNVQINKNLFDAGEYKVGFLLEGQTEVHYTNVSIK